MFYKQVLDFAWNILPQVSRSFALTIPFIEPPYREEIMVGYLEARILDTFEDCPLPLKLRERAMNLWIEALRKESFGPLNGIAHEVIQHVPEMSYRFLVENMDRVLFLHRMMSTFFKQASVKWFGIMKDGMLEYSIKPIMTFNDLDEYCYYVAGVVGRFLTDVVGSRETFRYDLLNEDAKAFGLFLQKVNITRDVRDDILHGRFFWPQFLVKDVGGYDGLLDERNREKSLVLLNKMVDSAWSHANAAERYIFNIPMSVKGYKKFCIVNFEMAKRTLLLLRDNEDVLYGEKPVKITRKDVKEIISYADEICSGI
jgi:farnesyl-diphosphate farnesyltransferase